MPKRKVNNKKQMGGELKYPKGLITQGSGRIDPTSGQDQLSVDDVPALLGANEYVLNSNTVRKVGTEFLDKLNNIGLSDQSNKIPPGVLGNSSKYQEGGHVQDDLNVSYVIGEARRGMSNVALSHKHEYYVDRYGNGVLYGSGKNKHYHEIKNNEVKSTNNHVHILTSEKIDRSKPKQKGKTRLAIGGTGGQSSLPSDIFSVCTNWRDCNHPHDVCLNGNCVPDFGYYKGTIRIEDSGRVHWTPYEQYDLQEHMSNWN